MSKNQNRIIETGNKIYPSYRLIAVMVMIIMIFGNMFLINAAYYTGIVTDSITGEPLPFVQIRSKDKKKGVLTDVNGVFKISLTPGDYITIKSMGYKEWRKKAPYSSSDTIHARLSTEERILTEVVVKRKKEKYSKKNNPAVELMQRLRHDRKQLDPFESPFYSYKKYDKTVLGINDYRTDLEKGNSLQRKFNFMTEYKDTAAWTGKPILDLSLKEKSSVRLSSRHPDSDKEVVTGIRSHGVDELYDQENVRKVLEDLLREIDIYGNDITFLQNRFVSPLSAIAADFYKFHITDTLPVLGEQCIELTFVPKSPESLGFNGKLFIPVSDSLKYVKRVSMRVPKDINLNYIDNIFISQNYEKDSLGNVHKLLDDVTLEMTIIPGTPSFYVSRQSRFNGFSYEKHPDYSGYYNMIGDSFIEEDAKSRDVEFWNSTRPIALSYAESQMGDMMSRFRKVPILYWGEKILKILTQGYVGTLPKGSRFNLGPVNTFISFNDVEGVRLKAGGMSTVNLSDHIFFRGYVAYGFRDHKWKYMGEAEYSFVRKKEYPKEFPLNSIRATYQFDKDQLGQHYVNTSPDNIFLSLKRMKNELITYRRFAKLEYNLELRNNLSFNAGYRYETQEATPWVTFRDGYGRNFRKFNQGSFFLTVRYAPGEKFLQGNTKRFRVNLDSPVITLTHEYGPKGMLASSFTMNRTEISIWKRFWLSTFGNIDILLKGSKIWSQVQFPALAWQNANLSYIIQPESFALLNPMEFAMDQYASWYVEYLMNGLILNRIPVIKKAKFREVVTFKGFVGHFSDKNNPDLNENLFRFPMDAHTMAMGHKPYMEISAGLDNILTCLRIDYVWRLSYRNRPGIDRSGLRINFHIAF